MIPEWLTVHPEVRAAIAGGSPVVALESAVLTHGLPRPINLELARRMHAEIQRAGAVPAMAAVIAGQPMLGITPEQLESLSLDEAAVKVSRRDLSLVRAAGKSGGTTVAAAIFMADAAGIPIFVTGGIGGVHRGSGGDVSADLLELARNRTVVVCSGAKSILDLPRTLEVLETAGVAVVGYQTDHFPGFFTRSSGLPVSSQVDTIDRLKSIVQAHLTLKPPSGLLIGVPCPEPEALAMEEIEELVARAERAAEKANLRGGQLTPFLLAQVSELSGGRTLAANLALLRNNARVAAELAVALA